MPRAVEVICHPPLKEDSVRTTTGLLGQVVGFLAAVEVWDNPCSKIGSFNP